MIKKNAILTGKWDEKQYGQCSVGLVFVFVFEK